MRASAQHRAHGLQGQGSLEVTPISAKAAISHDNWSEAWLRHIDEKLKRHEKIAAEATSPSTKKWHGSRARSLRTDRAAAVAHCGTDDIFVRCGCDQWMRLPRGCRKRVVCETCAKKRAREYARRVRLSLRHHLSVANAQRGTVTSKARVYMITLTIPHHDEVGRAEELLDDAWRALRAYAAVGHWTRSCLGVPEFTPGRDGRGHPHMHVVTVARWLDYGHVYATWREACESVGAGTPARAAQDFQVAKPRGGRSVEESAARYVSKYVSKTSTSKYTVEEWARIAAYAVGRRTFRASKGWWHYDKPQCECCEQHYVWVGPVGTATWANAVASVRDGFWAPQPDGARGPPPLVPGVAVDPDRIRRGVVAAWRDSLAPPN